MTQLDLINLPPVDRAQHGATWRDGNWQCRNWHGWFQSREGGRGNWRFHVPWFSNDDVTCTVYGIDAEGVTVRRDGVAIDRQNRITIEGRKYGRSHWDH